MKIKFWATVLMSIVLLAGCKSLGPVFTESVEKTSLFSFKRKYDILIVDYRENISDGLIILPITSYHGQHIFASPPLPEDLETYFQHLLYNSNKNPDRDVKFEIGILNSYQEFNSWGIFEYEYVDVELIVKVIDKADGKILDWKAARSWGQRRRFDAAYKSINRMYTNAFFQALHKSVEYLEV